MKAKCRNRTAKRRAVGVNCIKDFRIRNGVRVGYFCRMNYGLTLSFVLSLLALTGAFAQDSTHAAKPCWKFGVRYAYHLQSQNRFGTNSTTGVYGSSRYVFQGTDAISLTMENRYHWLAVGAPHFSRSGNPDNGRTTSLSIQDNYRFRFLYKKMLRPFVGASLDYVSLQYLNYTSGDYRIAYDRRNIVALTPDIGVEAAYRRFRLDLTLQGPLGIGLIDFRKNRVKTVSLQNGSQVYRSSSKRTTVLDGQGGRLMRQLVIGIAYVL